MSEYLKTVSSQYKHLATNMEQDFSDYCIDHASVLKNEPFSFQVLYSCPPANLVLPVSISVEASGIPVGSSGIPVETSDMPDETASIPTESSGIPAGSSGIPVDTSDMPDGASGIPAESSSIPVKVWRVDYVPVTNARNDYGESGYIGSQPGMYPDLLMERPATPTIRNKSLTSSFYCEENCQNLLNAMPGAWQSLWVTLNPSSLVMEP